MDAMVPKLICVVDDDESVRRTADRVQMQQVLLNLIMNGIEAMTGVTDRFREERRRMRDPQTTLRCLSLMTTLAYGPLLRAHG